MESLKEEKFIDVPPGFSPKPEMEKRKRKPTQYPDYETLPSIPQPHHSHSQSGLFDATLVYRRRQSSSGKKIRKAESWFKSIRAITNKRTRSQRYRSNLVSNISLCSNITLHQNHIDSISKTPFGEFLMPFLEKKISPNLVQKFDSEINKVLHTYNSSKRRFVIGEKELTITPVECQLIFGIKSGEKEMSIVREKRCKKPTTRKPTTGFVARRFPHIKKLRTKMLKDLLIELKDSDDETDINDITRIIILHLMAKFLFTTNSDTLVPWAFMEYVEDLDKMNDYNWAKEITSFLLESVHMSRPECVTGCTMLLTYWLCERTTLVKPTEEQAFPRFRKWILPSVTKKLNRISMEDIQPHQVHENPLKPSVKELQILGIIHENEEEYVDVESDDNGSERYEPLPKHRTLELEKDSRVHEIGGKNDWEGDKSDPSSQGTRSHFSMENHLDTTDLNEDIGSVNLNITNLEVENIINAIKTKHGNIDKDCNLKSEWMRKLNLVCICNVMKELQKKRLDELDIASLEHHYEVVSDIEKSNINVGWLLQRLDEIKDAITSRDEGKGFNDGKKECMKKLEEKKREVKILNKEIQMLEGQVERINKSISNRTPKFEKLQNMGLMHGLI